MPALRRQGVCRPPALRGCNPTVRVLGEPGKGWGRPHNHGWGSTWASQVGSHPGQTVEAGGREEPGQEPVCGLGPPRGHAVLDVDLSPELPSKPPHPPDPFSVLLLGMLPSREFRGAAPEPQPGSRCPGQMGLLLAGAAPQPDSHTPHGGWGQSYALASGHPPHPTQPSPAVGLGLAAPCPLSTQSAGEPAPRGMAFTSRGTAQRRKATGPGGAWGRSCPREPLKAEFCTGWRLFSAAGGNIGDANGSQICFK